MPLSVAALRLLVAIATDAITADINISFHSCRNRHCPKCQTNAREKWLRRRQQELLPVVYFHLVFSVPHVLVPLIWQNKKVLFTLLFDASAAALLEVASDPKRRLGAEIGFFGILHTWGQTLQRHPHIHYVVPGGGLSPDHTRWISTPTNFFLPVKVLSRVFRDKFVEGLEAPFADINISYSTGSVCHLPTRRHSPHFWTTCRAGLGGLCEASVWRSRTCPAVSGPLYASRGHLQSPASFGQRIRGPLPLEGLRESQQETDDDSHW